MLEFEITEFGIPKNRDKIGDLIPVPTIFTEFSKFRIERVRIFEIHLNFHERWVVVTSITT